MTKGEQARLVAWRLKILREAADEANVARVDRRSAEFRSLSCDCDPLSPHFVLSGFMRVADSGRPCADL
jgi:hypothetical protein